MNNSHSIKQNTRPDALPNFRNLGVILRILLMSNGLALLQSIQLANSWTEVPLRITQIAALLTPVLLSSLLLLWAAQDALNRLSYWQGATIVMSLVVGLTLSIYKYGGELYIQERSSKYFYEEFRCVLLSIGVTSLLLLYFRIREKMLSRATLDARLQVLRARIRPHFLFNTINAVLSIVRSKPKEAETALENMSDMFRVAMSDMEDLVPARREILLSEQYIGLEQLRMGDRLKVQWDLQNLPSDAMIPPLLLQPLLENAMYHGIEPLSQGGTINIVLRHSGDQLQIKVENPCVENSTWQKIGETTGAYEIVIPNTQKKHSGNKMALHNIRERLALLFDAEARYKIETGKNYYRVEIVLPYVKERTT